MAIGLICTTPYHILHFNDQRGRKHVPNGNLEINSTDLAILELKGHWTRIKHGWFQTHIIKKQSSTINGTTQLGWINVFNKCSEMLV